MVSIPLPTDDGAIQAAFTQVNAKMSAWTSAMSDAQRVVRGAATSARRLKAVPEDQTPPVPEDVPQAPAPAAATLPPPTVPVDVAPHRELPEAGEQTAAEPGATANTPVDSPPAQEKSNATLDEDESLLATLDDETAKAVRVMRRLNPGKKSVRELLEEYRASGADPSTQPKKKSWWTRK